MMLRSTILFAAAAAAAAVDSSRATTSDELSRRDKVHRPTYISEFVYTVKYDLSNGTVDTTKLIEEYLISFFKDDINRGVTTCQTKPQPSNPDTATPLPPRWPLRCWGPMVTDAKIPIAWFDGAAPMRAEVDGKQPNGTTRTMELHIVPKKGEGYQYRENNIFDSMDVDCTNKFNPPFSCALRTMNGYHSLRTQEYIDNSDVPPFADTVMVATS